MSTSEANLKGIRGGGKGCCGGSREDEEEDGEWWVEDEAEALSGERTEKFGGNRGLGVSGGGGGRSSFCCRGKR